MRIIIKKYLLNLSLIIGFMIVMGIMRGYGVREFTGDLSLIPLAMVLSVLPVLFEKYKINK